MPAANGMALSAAAQEKLLAYAECEEAMQLFNSRPARQPLLGEVFDVLKRHGFRHESNVYRFVELLRKEALALVAMSKTVDDGAGPFYLGDSISQGTPWPTPRITGKRR